MAMTKSTQGLLVLLGVVLVAGGAWYGWQYFSSNKEPVAETQSVAASGSKPLTQSAAPADHGKLVDPGKLVDEVLRVTGLTRQLEQLPEQISGGMAMAPNSEKVPPEMARAIEKVITDSFSEEDIRAQVVAQLKAQFDQKRLQALAADFSTPLVKRIVDMESKPGTPEAQTAFFNALAAKPLPPARVKALQQLDRAAKVSDLSAEIALAAFNAMMGAMVSDFPGDHAQFEREMAKQRGPMLDSIRGSVMSSMAYVYRDASDADLASYAKLYETDHAQWFSRIAMGALKQGINNASKRSGERLGGLFKSQAIQQAKVKGATPSTAAPSAAPLQQETKPAMAQQDTPAPQKRRKPAGDIQKCLELEDSRAIAKCAEQYR